jgi:hypothetical protein
VFIQNLEFLDAEGVTLVAYMFKELILNVNFGSSNT